MYSTKTPIWFWIVSLIAILWNLMGVYSFYSHTFISDEALSALSEAERGLYENFPAWVTIAFAVAVFSGLLGSIGLILKQKWANTLFVISFVAIVLQMTYSMFFTKSIEVYGLAQTLIMPLVVIAFAIFLIWFSGYVRRFEWHNS